MKRKEPLEKIPNPIIRIVGAIRLMSDKGFVATRWWSKKCLSFLQNVADPDRLERGYQYARIGRITRYQSFPGRITAEVVGSKPHPYQVDIRFEVFTAQESELIVTKIDANALVSIQLINNVLAPEIESLFHGLSSTFFPTLEEKPVMTCTCEDTVVPCKHCCAVLYVLIEAMDKNPFLLFQLKGMSKEDVLSNLSLNAMGNIGCDPATERQPESLPITPGDFWGRNISDPVFGQEPFRNHLSVIRKLGHLPFWMGEVNFVSTMTDLYNKARQQGIHLKEFFS